jgi:glucose-1-phosphate cytidylyltransferase
MSPKVVLLCGGLGTRLREETEYRPKPMVEVGGRPILWHLMKVYAQQGFNDFVLALGYRGNVIREYFLNYEAMNSDFTVTLGQQAVNLHDAHGEAGYQVTLAETGPETMTGGRIKRVGRHLGGRTFMATYGDGLADIDLQKLLAFHRAHGKLATVTVVKPRSRFGIIEVSDDARVLSFAEKPVMDSWVNMGFFVFEPEVLEYLDGDACVLEREPLERLAADGQLNAYRHEGFFFAMDTYREYKELNDIWSSGHAPWKNW